MAKTFWSVGGSSDDDSTDDGSSDDELTDEEFKKMLNTTGKGGIVAIIMSTLHRLFGEQGLAELQAFASDPTGYVLGFMLGWIVSRVVALAKWIIAQILIITDGIIDGLGMIGGALVAPFAFLFTGGSAGLVATHRAAVEMVVSLGIVGGPAAVLVIGAEMFLALVAVDLLIRVGFISLLGSIPVVGGVFNVVGQLYIVSKGAFGRLKEVVT